MTQQCTHARRAARRANGSALFGLSALAGSVAHVKPAIHTEWRVIKTTHTLAKLDSHQPATGGG